MAKPLQKLELTWIGKGNEPQLAPLFVAKKNSGNGQINIKTQMMITDV